MEEIPVLDLSTFRAGTPGAKQKLAADLAHVFEHVGFYFIVNHGVPQSLIEATFAAARRFHDQPLEKKLEIRLNQYNIGYLPMRGAVTRHSALNANNKPNVDLAAGHLLYGLAWGYDLLYHDLTENERARYREKP